MFRLSEAGMPEDPSYPASLKELGFFIGENSEIRTIKPPHNYYNFWLSNNDRVNEAFREAMHACIKREINDRMTALGMPQLYLPQLTREKPDEPAVPIFVTNQDELRKRKRILVVINDDFQDLGLWAYRIASKEGGVEAGSVVSLAKAMQTNQFAAAKASDTPEADATTGAGESSSENLDGRPRSTSPAAVRSQGKECHGIKEGLISKPGTSTTPGSELTAKAPVATAEDATFKIPDNWKTPGLVVLNPGQLLYSHRLGKAMTKQSWASQPLKSGVHPVPRIDPVYNRVEGNRTIEEHIKTVFDNLISNPEWVSREANIYVIGIGNGGDAVLRVLSKEWTSYKDRVAAIALTDPAPINDLFDDHDFVAFLRHRARALVPSPEPFSTPVAVPSSTGHSEEVEQRKNSDEFVKRQESTSDPASPWLEEISDTSPSKLISSIISGASDALTSSISQLAIDSIAASPTEPIRTTPDHSQEWGYHYYPILSSGERVFGEIIFPIAYRAFLAWFETVATTPNYRNPAFQVPEPTMDDAQIFDANETLPISSDSASVSETATVPLASASASGPAAEGKVLGDITNKTADEQGVRSAEGMDPGAAGSEAADVQK